MPLGIWSSDLEESQNVCRYLFHLHFLELSPKSGFSFSNTAQYNLFPPTRLDLFRDFLATFHDAHEDCLVRMLCMIRLMFEGFHVDHVVMNVDSPFLKEFFQVFWEG